MTLLERVPGSSHDEYHFRERFGKRQPVLYDMLTTDDLEKWTVAATNTAKLGRDVFEWGSGKLVPKRHKEWKLGNKRATIASTKKYEDEVYGIINSTRTNKSSKLAKLREMHSRS